ncbi:MAG: FtsQ-type POTRA domain-containing protein [Clostridiaceae bacterium]
MTNTRFKNNRQESPERVSELLIRRDQARRQRQSRLFRILTRSGIGLLLIVIFFFSPLFKIRQVSLKGFAHADQAKITARANAEIGRHALLVGRSALRQDVLADPYLRNVRIKSSLLGTLTIEVEEYPQEYALIQEGQVVVLDRQGRVLSSQIIIPPNIVELVDDTKPLAPGHTMYGEGIKKNVMVEFMALMDQNTSDIRFSRLILTDPADLKLESGGWVVELGDGASLEQKVNRAINILKVVKIQEEPAIIDLKFNADPVIRPKGES